VLAEFIRCRYDLLRSLVCCHKKFTKIYGRIFLMLAAIFLLILSCYVINHLFLIIELLQKQSFKDRSNATMVAVFFFWSFLMYINTEPFFEQLAGNYLTGMAAIILCLFYSKIISALPSRNQHFVNVTFMYIFLYTFCFLTYSDIPFHSGYDYAESSFLGTSKATASIAVKYLLSIGPYIIYGVVMLLVLISWSNCINKVWENED